ncbi:MAG: hypothetical protein ABIC82_00005 [bacterium]
MPAQPQEKNIDDLLSQQHGNDESRVQSELRREQVKAKKQKAVSPVLGDIPQGASNSKQSADRQTNGEQPRADNRQKGETQEDEEKVNKIPLWQIRKRKRTIKKLRELGKELNKLKKLIGKYKSTNFFFLALLACFIEMADLPIAFLWATVVLSPIAICIGILKGSASLFIYIKIYNIKNEQKTKDAWWWSLIAFVVGLIPCINVLPETLVRVRQAHNSAKAAFEKHKDEIKKIEKEMSKLIKQLG